MRVLFAGGGTAGHINPALAIAGYVRDHDPSASILYVGAIGKMEEELVGKAGFDFRGINVSGFSRDISFEGLSKNVIALKRIVTSSIESRKILKEFRPDICVGTGGYVSGTILNTAASMNIPIIIHEQNAYPGVTNKMLAKKAKWVMLAVKDAKKHFKSDVNIVVTGNPVRQEVITASYESSRKALNLDHRPVILSFGGSLGAKSINEAVAYLMANTAKSDEYQHIHAYGKNGGWFPNFIGDLGVNLARHNNFKVMEYIDNMQQCLAAADLVICRAGAITLSELQVQGKPSILIPSPFVAENHQYHNAMALVNQGAASIIEEKNLTGELLTSTVKKMLASDKCLQQYGHNAKKMAIVDATERIYRIMKEVCAGSPV